MRACFNFWTFCRHQWTRGKRDNNALLFENNKYSKIYGYIPVKAVSLSLVWFSC